MESQHKITPPQQQGTEMGVASLDKIVLSAGLVAKLEGATNLRRERTDGHPEDIKRACDASELLNLAIGRIAEIH